MNLIPFALSFFILIKKYRRVEMYVPPSDFAKAANVENG